MKKIMFVLINLIGFYFLTTLNVCAETEYIGKYKTDTHDFDSTGNTYGQFDNGSSSENIDNNSEPYDPTNIPDSPGFIYDKYGNPYYPDGFSPYSDRIPLNSERVSGPDNLEPPPKSLEEIK